ncbi:MAG: hypothetical protein IT305_05565 [Chloroflexi bacterium]|nr:hypothetical protein [Chloroflexota bacterium]
MMWLFILVYLMGICGGVAANVLFDVRLRKPALSRQITLAALGVVLAVIVYQTSTRMQEWVLLTVWATTGVLAGLGSRESRAPIP